MRQLTFDETQSVGGAACEDINLSVSYTGLSLNGSVGDFADCLSIAGTFVMDTFNAFSAHISTGIPYGEPHVG